MYFNYSVHRAAALACDISHSSVTSAIYFRAKDTVFTRLSAAAFIFFNRLKGGRHLFEGGAYSRAAFKYWAK